MGQRVLCQIISNNSMIGHSPYQKGLAYIDDQTQEEIRTTRGTIKPRESTVPGATVP